MRPAEFDNWLDAVNKEVIDRRWRNGKRSYVACPRITGLRGTMAAFESCAQGLLDFVVAWVVATLGWFVVVLERLVLLTFPGGGGPLPLSSD